MIYDVIVIGGGPVGCAVARDIAAAGYRVLVIEEHREIGIPVQCAGLISERALEISRVPSSVVLNRLYGAVVYAPGGNILKLEGKKVYALVIDRQAFDRSLMEQARCAGAEILCDRRAVKFDYTSEGVQVETKSNKDQNNLFTCRLVIGADGHNSAVARWRSLSSSLEKVSLYAAEVLLPDCSGRFAQIFLDHRLAPGWFGWIFPAGNDLARAGVGSSPLAAEKGAESPRLLFEKLVASYPDVFQGMKVLQNTGGVVPIGFLERTYDHHVLLVGDAAAHVKPISGGGLFFGLRAAEYCAATVLAALRAKNFGRDFLSAYQRKWEADIGLEINCGLKHREVFLEMKNKDIEFLTSFLNKAVWKKLILKYGDLDYHSWLAARLAFLPPWASRFLTAGLKSILQDEEKIKKGSVL